MTHTTQRSRPTGGTINLVERSRSAGSGVLLSAQSAAGLGDETERERLLAAASAVILFRSPMPAELAQLAGSERVAEAAWQLDGDDVTGRSTVTMRPRGRIDADRVRNAPTGVAEIIAAGRVERARIIRPAVCVETHAHGLWAFGDSVAWATQAWWSTLDVQTTEEDPNPGSSP